MFIASALLSSSWLFAVFPIRCLLSISNSFRLYIRHHISTASLSDINWLAHSIFDLSPLQRWGVGGKRCNWIQGRSTKHSNPLNWNLKLKRWQLNRTISLLHLDPSFSARQRTCWRRINAIISRNKCAGSILKFYGKSFLYFIVGNKILIIYPMAAGSNNISTYLVD